MTAHLRLCPVCQKLERELQSRVLVHDDKLDALRTNAETASSAVYRELLVAESDAGLDLGIARGEFYQHRQHHRNAN